MRTRRTTLTGALASLLIISAGCTPSEPEAPPEQPAVPPPAAQPPAAQVPPGQPPAPAGEVGQAQPTPMGLVIDELYVDAEPDPDEGQPPLTVKFNTTVEDATGEVKCEWDFGDGTPKSGDMNPQHIYQKEGDFIALVKCKDSKGIEGETEVDVTVYNDEG